MIAAGGNQMVNVYDVGNGGLRCSYGNELGIESVRFSPDGRQIASCGGDGGLRIFDRCTRQTWLAAPPRTHRVSSGRQLPVGLWCVAYSPDGGRLAAAARDGVITIWDASTTPQWTRVRNGKSDGGPAAFAFSHDGKRLVIGGENDESLGPGFQLWDTSNRHLKLLSQVGDTEASCFCFSLNGADLVVARKRTIDIYDAVNLKRRRRMDLPAGTIAGPLGIDASGSLIVLVHAPGSIRTTIHVYDVKSGVELGTIGEPFNFQQPGELRIAFPATGTKLGTLSQRDRTSSINIYSLPDGHRTSIEFEPGIWVGEFAISPTEPLMAVANAGDIQFWDTEHGRLQGSLRDIWHESGPLEFSADGRLLIMASYEQHNVQIWDVRQRQPLFKLPLPRQAALQASHWSLSICPDGRKIACSARNAKGSGPGVYLYSGLPAAGGL